MIFGGPVPLHSLYGPRDAPGCDDRKRKAAAKSVFRALEFVENFCVDACVSDIL